MTSRIRINRLSLLAVCAVICVFISVSGVFAQSGTGTVQGAVTDPSGSVVPGAQIV
jgi:hypothetical protein